MASFSAFLEVKGTRYPLLGYDLSIHQETDSLGRPASPTLGGTIDCVLSSPGSDQPFLHQWMFSPTMQEDGKLVLMQDSPRATLKTISFFNAYCTGLQTNFVPGDTGGGSLQMQVRISPQRIAVGAIIHDNNWPLVSHGAGETFAEIPVTPIAKGKAKADEEPGLFSDIAHTVLDVAGLVPVIGELADGANALYYLAEGNKTDAALSAAAMIPIAGWAATGGKLLRKGLKIAAKAKAVKKASDKVTKGAKAVKAAAKRKAVKAVEALPEARIGQSKISKADYDKLRSKTPTKKIQQQVNENYVKGMPDEALPGLKVDSPLHADHIVPMKQITQMDGFEKLTEAQQLSVLNNTENFKGLSEAANTSKGSKTYEQWTKYKKGEIDVDPAFRAKMIKAEKETSKKLQKQIDDFVNLPK